MNTYADMMEELGVQYKLPEMEYTKLVQARSTDFTPDQVLKEVNAALDISSQLAQPPTDHLVNLNSSGEEAVDGGGVVDKDNLPAVAQLTHHLNNILCIVSENYTSQNSLKLEVTEWKEKAALGLGRYKHNQQLEQLRSQQEQLSEDRRSWAIKKQEQDKEFRSKSEALAKLQASLEQEKKDVEQQRDKLYRKLEALKAQGIDISPNMTVIGANQHSAAPQEPHFIMEVRKAVSPSSTETVRKGMSVSNTPTSTQSPGTSNNTQQQSNSSANSVNQNLISATIQTKGEVVEVKQQIPSKLAKLSLAGGNKNREKKLSSVARPSVTSLHQQQHQQQQQQQQQQNTTSGGGTGQQLLPYKLSESDKKTSSAGLASGVSSAGLAVSPKGYQKLSSSSFAEDRVGRPTYRGEETASHARTGSSPAAMSGRPMSSSNTLPKLSAPRGITTTAGSSEASPPPTSSVRQQMAPASMPPDADMKHGRQMDNRTHHQPMVHRVNYSDTGEEVFFF